MSLEVTVVIPSYNSGETLARVVEAVLGQQTSRKFEVLVVDSSEDKSFPASLALKGKLKVERSQHRLGPAAARNRGASRSESPLLAFIDADAVPREDWLETLVSCLDDPAVKLASGWIEAPPTTDSWERVQHWIEFSEFVRGSSTGPREAVPSCNWLLRRQDFERLGGFDETLMMSEDLDFCRRLGGGIEFCSTSGVTHHGRRGRDAVLRHLFDLGFWSGQYRRREKIRGSQLARFPAIIWLLPVLRLFRIWKRTWRVSADDGLAAMISSHRLLAGLFTWTRGFKRGLVGSRAERPVDDKVSSPLER